MKDKITYDDATQLVREIAYYNRMLNLYGLNLYGYGRSLLVDPRDLSRYSVILDLRSENNIVARLVQPIDISMPDVASDVIDRILTDFVKNIDKRIDETTSLLAKEHPEHKDIIHQVSLGLKKEHGEIIKRVFRRGYRNER